MTGPYVQRRPRRGGAQDRPGSSISTTVAAPTGLLRAASVAVRAALGGPDSGAGADLADALFGRDRAPLGEVVVWVGADTEVVVHVSVRRRWRALIGGRR